MQYTRPREAGTYSSDRPESWVSLSEQTLSVALPPLDNTFRGTKESGIKIT